MRAATWLLGLYGWLLPRPDVIFMSDVPAEVALDRKDDIPSLEYAQELRRMYLFAARQEGAIVLDGTRPPKELVHDVIGRLQYLIREK